MNQFSVVDGNLSFYVHKFLIYSIFFFKLLEKYLKEKKTIVLLFNNCA